MALNGLIKGSLLGKPVIINDNGERRSGVVSKVYDEESGGVAVTVFTGEVNEPTRTMTSRFDDKLDIGTCWFDWGDQAVVNAGALPKDFEIVAEPGEIVAEETPETPVAEENANVEASADDAKSKKKKK